jgi:membrane protein implicated in regulation of membrane protease activity
METIIAIFFIFVSLILIQLGMIRGDKFLWVTSTISLVAAALYALSMVPWWNVVVILALPIVHLTISMLKLVVHERKEKQRFKLREEMALMALTTDNRGHEILNGVCQNCGLSAGFIVYQNHRCVTVA